MRSTIRTASCLLLAAVFASSAGAGTIAYPTTQKPAFLVDVPDKWDLEPAEEAGGFFSVTGPTGVGKTEVARPWAATNCSNARAVAHPNA